MGLLLETHITAPYWKTADKAIAEFAAQEGITITRVRYLNFGDCSFVAEYNGGKYPYTCVFVRGVPNCSPDTWRIKQGS